MRTITMNGLDLKVEFRRNYRNLMVLNFAIV